jgi:hypothetical protein
MAIVSFTLNPEALGKLHEALVCLGKFSEAVSLEASHDRVSNSGVVFRQSIAEQMLSWF